MTHHPKPIPVPLPKEIRALRRTVRMQAGRMALVYGLLAGLIVWQKHFILGGIESNPYLNAIIIGVFVFGSWLAVRSLYGLRNDIVAFQALKEVYDDALALEIDAGEVSAARYERCREAGVVYRSPDLLGHVFDLTIEELLRARHMRISVATMQNLMSAIDSRMAHQRSLIGYLTGLSVFLGLIGTFIGLMEMVGSVGGIIGGLASGDAGSPDSIKRLIHDLEAPLVGMATGFSCSLFGLFGSLMLGLVGRMSNTAAYAIKEEYEAWLAGISEIESERPANGAGGAGGTGERRLAASQLAIARALASSQKAFEGIVSELERLSARQETQTDLLERTTRVMLDAAERDRLTLDSLRKVSDLRETIEHMRDDARRRDENTSLCMMTGFERLAKISQTHDITTIEAIASLTHRQAQTLDMLQPLLEDKRVDALAHDAAERHASAMRSLGELGASQTVLSSAVRRLADHAEQRSDDGLVANAIVYAVNSGVGNLAGAMHETIETLSSAIRALTEEQKRTQTLLARQDNQDLSRDIARLGETLQDGIATSVQDIATSVETAFQAYARLLEITRATRKTDVEQTTNPSLKAS